MPDEPLPFPPSDEPAHGDVGPAEVARTDDVPADAPRPGARAVTLTLSMLVSAAVFAVMLVVPTAYAVSSPGPTKDVLGEDQGKPLITISGAPTYPSTGELHLTTVSATGGPGYPSTPLRVLQGWFSPWSNVQPREVLFPDAGETREQVDKANQQAMVSSQENASVAALTELGYEVPATLTVAGAVQGSHAEGVVQTGDIIVALDGTPLPDYQSLLDGLAGVEAGDTITLTVRRNGAEKDLTIETGTKVDGSAMIGVYIDPTFDMPVDITISIDGIGGPSAGTMFALGIVDKMTKLDEANGEVIAGTGTIDVNGAVGPIGGIRQKLEGARRDGATWFLAPASNCKEVVGHVPGDLHVAKIATLHEAREAMTAIGAGKGASLPTCTAG
ncbi:YlbL family protein [Cellulomonas edaphi]|uniref:S16 family serine protease n=1 Tax=Cellulomonas edaphi TaxID=3053468 RepID=A0ABT7S8F7_9CELL|nr:S16 family serine protease [Cellulomons edaphi]MDM7831876.1 S16 family serine protease [Cellulomons edaphi]